MSKKQKPQPNKIVLSYRGAATCALCGYIFLPSASLQFDVMDGDGTNRENKEACWQCAQRRGYTINPENIGEIFHVLEQADRAANGGPVADCQVD